MNQRGAILMILTSVIIGLIAVYVSFLPDIIVTKTSVEISTNTKEFKNYLSKASNWQDWILSEGKHEIRIVDIDIKQGEETAIKWFSEEEGDGGLAVKEVTDSTVLFEMITDDNQFRNRGWLKYKENNGVIEVNWLDSFDVSTNFQARLAGENEEFLKMVKEANQKNLNRLKAALEK